MDRGYERLQAKTDAKHPLHGFDAKGSLHGFFIIISSNKTDATGKAMQRARCMGLSA